MIDVLNISSKNSYLTSKQWEEIKEYVKNRKNRTVEIETVETEETAGLVYDVDAVETSESVMMFSTRPTEIHSDAYNQMVTATSVSEMYEVMLMIMNENPESLYEMSEDEIQSLYDTATEMNEENPSDDYVDLIDTLQFLAGDYDLNGAVTLPSGTVLGTSGGTLASGEYYLNSNINLTNNITVAGNVTIDLNGYVLNGTGSGNVITDNGNLTIKDSNPQKANYGTVNENGVWTFTNSTSGTVIYGGIITNKGAGKGIAVNNTCTMTGGTITGCVGTFGSAITVSSSGKFYMTGGKILYNYITSTTYGGAVYGEVAHSNNGSFISLSNAELSYNNTLGNGGAIYGYKVELSNTIVSNNTAAKNGGGIYINNDEAVGENAYLKVLNNSVVNDNCSIIYGGGIYCSGDFTLSDSSVNYNICGADESDIETGKLKNQGRGGAIFLSQSKTGKTSNSVFENVEIKHNKAMYYGGAVQTGGVNTFLTFNSGEISENEAILGGAAAVHVTSSSTFTINGGSISNNMCEGRGGAIHSAYGCTVNLNGGAIESNKVYGRGAGVHVNVGGIINLNGTTIQNNKSYSGYRTKFCKLENKIFTKLTTGEEIFEEGIGGGIVIDSGEFNMTQGDILNNYAEVAGGGVAMVMYSVSSGHDNKIVKFNISDGNILNNSTDGNGGGIYLMRNTIAELDPEEYPDISEELRTGIPKLTATGGVIANNFAQNNGGAIYQEENTKFICGENAEILNNTASDGGAVYIAQGEAEINGGNIAGNTASNNGGAIYIKGSLVMTNGTFDNNTSEQSGGAIYITNGNANIDSGTISNNIALDSGGAIAVTSGNVTIGTKSCYDAGESSTHVHPVIESNIASNGGGIYVNGGETVMWCGDIKDNRTYEETVNVLVNGGSFSYSGGTIGIPFDSGVYVEGGDFIDNTSSEDNPIKCELHYHSVLIPDVQEHEIDCNGYIPESKWIGSPKGNVLHQEPDETTPTWGDLFPDYKFVGWENRPENDTDKIVNLYAIWEEK